MFTIIQFAPEDGGSVSIVNKQWFTPRRCEVYWPPTKGTKAFDRILMDESLTPDERWKLYSVQRIFYETDDIEKAKRKLKLVEVTSDVQSQSEEENVDKVPMKRKPCYNRRYLSSEGEDDERYERPPPLKKKFVQLNEDHCKKASPTKALQNELPSTFVKIVPSSVDLRTLQKASEQEDTVSEFTLSDSILQRNLSTLFNESAQQNKPDLTDYQEKVLSLLSFIKTQNELILSLLTNSNIATGTLKTEFKFPITSLEGLDATEKLLDNAEFSGNLIAYLKTLGGRDLSYKTSRILKFVLADNVATQFNFFGKRSNKKPFSQLKLCAAIIEAVKVSTSGVITTKDIEDAIKVWLKHAPEREKKQLIQRNKPSKNVD